MYIQVTRAHHRYCGVQKVITSDLKVEWSSLTWKVLCTVHCREATFVCTQVCTASGGRRRRVRSAGGATQSAAPATATRTAASTPVATSPPASASARSGSLSFRLSLSLSLFGSEIRANGFATAFVCKKSCLADLSIVSCHAMLALSENNCSVPPLTEY